MDLEKQYNHTQKFFAKIEKCLENMWGWERPEGKGNKKTPFTLHEDKNKNLEIELCSDEKRLDSFRGIVEYKKYINDLSVDNIQKKLDENNIVYSWFWKDELELPKYKKLYKGREDSITYDEYKYSMISAEKPTSCILIRKPEIQKILKFEKLSLGRL